MEAGRSNPWEGFGMGEETKMCNHTPACPDVRDSNCCGAHVVSDRSGQGWCRLCNGIILFDDGHYLTPDGHDQLVSA